MPKFYIAHDQDLIDFVSFAKTQRKPFVVHVTQAQVKTRDWNDLNSFFHRTIVRVYSSLSGLLDDEAKEDLQIRFALMGERENEYDVESISGMSYNRLLEFVNKCEIFLMTQFGARADELLIENKLKTIKKK